MQSALILVLVPLSCKRKRATNCASSDPTKRQPLHKSCLAQRQHYNYPIEWCREHAQYHTIVNLLHDCLVPLQDRSYARISKRKKKTKIEDHCTTQSGPRYWRPIKAYHIAVSCGESVANSTFAIFYLCRD